MKLSIVTVNSFLTINSFSDVMPGADAEMKSSGLNSYPRENQNNIPKDETQYCNYIL